MAPRRAKPSIVAQRTAFDEAHSGPKDLPLPEGEGRAFAAPKRLRPRRRGEGERNADFDACSNAESRPPDSRRTGVRCSARTRVGKIARLPNEVREELNRRLQDGEPGDGLLKWLNSLPKAREVLTGQFGGRPINKQNLSDWKQGGYRDWERAEEDRLRVDRLTEQAAQLVRSDEESPFFSERLAAVLLVELAGVLDDLRDESLPPAERWQLLRQMLREAAQARREDNRAAKLRIEQDRWEWERERMSDERTKRWAEQRKEELFAPIKLAFIELPMLAQFFGGGEQGRKAAAEYLETEHDLPPGTLGASKPSSPVKPCQGKPASRRRSKRSKRSDRSDRSDRSVSSGESATEVRAKPSQGQSSPVKPNRDQAEGAEETRREDVGGPDSVEPGRESGA